MSDVELAMYGITLINEIQSVKESLEIGKGEDAAIRAYNKYIYMAKLEAGLKEFKK
ncbi:MAG: hypothetical protein ACRCX7_12470 [Cetobacterium sp.]|uniref:hypothetical protein n=1 Tax=Cetobacterium sp. TaxID=2071632 RepID=UPI003F2AEB7B